MLTRRELLAAASALPAFAQRSAPTAPVAIAKPGDYAVDVAAELDRMFDQLGGLGRIVKNKTVTVKLNLTGSPGLRFQGRPLGVTHYTHPKLVEAAAHLMARAGAKRIRFVESGYGWSAPLEEYLLDSGWNVRRLKAIAPAVEFENTNNLGSGKSYARVKVPRGAVMFPAYDLNRAFVDTDVLVSMAKLKNHEVCGVTLSMKNCFGNTPASIYGDDAGVDEPNEKPTKGRVKALHDGKRAAAKSAPQELDPSSPREAGYRVPRIVAELCAARPVDLAIIDGIEALAGGEGPWIQGNLRVVKPGLLIAGTNPVTTDSVATAAMGYDPRAVKGSKPFRNGDNHLLLAERLGIGTTDLQNIEVAGVAIAEARFPYES